MPPVPLTLLVPLQRSHLTQRHRRRKIYSHASPQEFTMRPLASIASFCLLFFLQTLVGQDFSEALSLIEPSTVLIRTLDSEDKAGLGTGFFIDDKGLLITNAHVIDGASSAVVQLSDGAVTSITSIKAIYPEADIAFLNTGLNTSRAVKLAPGSAIKRGSAVAVLGNPEGIGLFTFNRDCRRASQRQLDGLYTIHRADFQGIQRKPRFRSGRQGGWDCHEVPGRRAKLEFRCEFDSDLGIADSGGRTAPEEVEAVRPVQRCPVPYTDRDDLGSN